MTRDGNGGPMRTEDDLRQALATLERHAPDAGAVLSAVRGAAGGGARLGRPSRIRRWRPPEAHQWWRRPRLALSLAATAAAAGLVITLLPGSRPARPAHGSGRSAQAGLPGGPPVAAGLPTAASVGRAMLTAFKGATGDIEYTTQTGINKGVTADVYRTWSWPAAPAPGQRQVERTLFAQRTPQVPVLTMTEDNAVAYTTPRAGVATLRGRVTMVCYAGTGQTGCGFGETQTAPGTWSQVSQKVWVSASDITGAGGLSAADLARGIAKGYWQVVRRTRLEGQPAIELNETGRGPEVWDPLPTLLWVNARTHLPIRMVNGVGHATVSTNEWAFLRPTPANVALLRVRIPPGYPRSVPQR
ncbi:MAG: hypothetical protein ACR2MP_27410 [Streptosporangiaceae bacterium]